MAFICEKEGTPCGSCSHLRYNEYEARYECFAEQDMKECHEQNMEGVTAESEKKPDAVFTREEAANIVEAFENVLEDQNITLSSPEDKEKDPDNAARLYGSTYYDLLDAIEEALKAVVKRVKDGSEVIEDQFN